MSGAVLHWKPVNKGGWDGFSGSHRVACVRFADSTEDYEGGWDWTVETTGGAVWGEADAAEACRTAAEAVWSKWCATAELDPVGEVRRLRAALLDALATFDVGEGTRFRDAYREVIQRAQDAAEREAMQDAARPEAAP